MDNLELMRKRLVWQGGVEQENRMIHDKFRTLQRAMAYSYQACTVAKLQSFSSCLSEDEEIEIHGLRALINSDKVKQDYDDKIISIPYESGFVPGDVFEWCKTDTQWIIYLQELTEDAYFRGEIRRCRYIIKFKDSNGKIWSTYAAIRGPVETQINSIQKNQIRLGQANLSLNILLPRNELTLAAFDRYSEFMFEGKCWRVEAPDSISMKNILEINAEEYYINRETDNDVKNGLIVEPINPTPNSEITGTGLIRPLIAEKFTVDEAGGTWSIKEKCLPIDIKEIDSRSVELTWRKSTARQQNFTLVWQKDNKVYEKFIIVESLF